MQNVAASMLGGAKAEYRLKHLISEFVALDGNRLCVLQDGEKMAIGIVMQAREQDQIFERWPDWTFGTDSAGYHLARLLDCSNDVAI
jgi:hypothetical protein